MTVLLQYTIAGNSLDPTTEASGVSGGTLTNGSLNVFHAYSPGFASDPILDCNPISNAVNAATAVQYNSYFSFTLTPGEGKQMDLSSLTFNASRGGSSTPRGWVLRSSVDAYAANIATDTVDTQVTTWDPFTVDLSGAAFQGLTEAITFRVYVYCPDSGKALEFDDITVNGTVRDRAATLVAYSDPDDWYLQDPQAVFADACNGPNPTYSDNNHETYHWLGYDYGYSGPGLHNLHPMFWRFNTTSVGVGDDIGGVAMYLTQGANQFEVAQLVEVYAFNWGVLGLGDTGNWRNAAWLQAEYAAGRRCAYCQGQDFEYRVPLELTSEYLAQAIVKGGWTYLMGTIESNRTTTTPGGLARGAVYTGDHATEEWRPRLEIEHTPGAGSSYLPGVMGTRIIAKGIRTYG